MAPPGPRPNHRQLSPGNRFSWNTVGEQNDAPGDVIHVNEIAIRLAMIVNVDRGALENGLGEFEQRDIGASPRSIGGEVANHSGWASSTSARSNAPSPRWPFWLS